MAIRTTQNRASSKSCQTTINTDFIPRRRTLLAQAVSTALIAGIASAPLPAQELVLEEIIVTATKREESVMDVPLAIQALTGEFIKEANFNNVKDLARFSPSITGSSSDSFFDSIAVRGIGSYDYGNGGDPSLGMYKNGLYQGRTGTGVFTLFDIERAEILRGPQGFLFGRNSISGAMSVYTVKPENGVTNGYVDVNVGERGVLRVQGAANATLSDTVTVRFAAQSQQEDGYVSNVYNGEKWVDIGNSAFRLTGVYDNDDVQVTLIAEYEERDQDGAIYKPNGTSGSWALLESLYGPLGDPDDPLAINQKDSVNGTFDDAEILSLSMEITTDTRWGQFKSLTGYKDHDYKYSESFPATILTIFDYEQHQNGQYFEQEFRLNSDSEGPLSWYAGVSFYNEDIDTMFMGRQDESIYCDVYWYNSCQGLFDFYNTSYGGAYAYVLDDYFGTYTWTPSPTGYMEDWNQTIGKYRGWATYVDLNYEFTETFDASFGIRYNWDQKKMSQDVLSALNTSPELGQRVQTGYTTPDGPITDKADWSDFTYRLALNYRPNENTLWFVTAATGYKQGGFNSFTVDPVGTLWGRDIALPDTHSLAEFAGESSISFDLGYKGTVMQGRTQIAVNLFHYVFKDLQSICTATTPVYEACNVGELTGYGVEATLNTILTKNWRAMVGMSYFDSEGKELQEFCYEGVRVFDDIDACEGQSIPAIPEWKWFASLNMDYPVGNGSLFGDLNWTWEGERRSGWLPLVPETTTFPESNYMVPGFSIVNLTVGYKSAGSWSAAIYADNLFDEEYFSGGWNGGVADMYPGAAWGPGRPLTMGVRVTVNFD